MVENLGEGAGIAILVITLFFVLLSLSLTIYSLAANYAFNLMSDIKDKFLVRYPAATTVTSLISYDMFADNWLYGLLIFIAGFIIIMAMSAVGVYRATRHKKLGDQHERYY